MAANTDPIFIGSITAKITSFPAATSTTEADIIDVDATLDRRIDCISIATDDTAVSLFNLYLSDGTNDFPLTNVPVSITAGATALGATAPVNVLAHANLASFVQADSAGNKFMNLPKGWKLRGKFNAALTTGKTAWVAVRGGKY